MSEETPKKTKSKVKKVIAVVQSLPVGDQQKAEAINELNDLLEPAKQENKDKIFVGYHPITGDEVWQ